MLSCSFKRFLFSALWILSVLWLSFSEEIWFTTLLHLVVIWINIRAVSSAVWEHNASLCFWTKTPSSNDSGLLLLAHVGLVMLYFAEWIHSLCCLYFYSFSWASSTNVTQTLVCHFHMFAVSGRQRQEGEDHLTVWQESLSLEFDRQLIGAAVWHTAASGGSVCVVIRWRDSCGLGCLGQMADSQDLMFAIMSLCWLVMLMPCLVTTVPSFCPMFASLGLALVNQLLSGE